MFGFFKSKSLFEQHYSKFVSQPVIKKSPNHKPITAAYLYVLSDYMHMAKGNQSKRNENSQKVITTIKQKILTPSEMKVFDRAVDLLGAIARNQISVKGFWCFAEKSDKSNPIFRFFLCYGDLIQTPKYLDNYENAPVVIYPITDIMDFTMKFNRILDMTKAYLDAI